MMYCRISFLTTCEGVTSRPAQTSSKIFFLRGSIRMVSRAVRFSTRTLYVNRMLLLVRAQSCLAHQGCHARMLGAHACGKRLRRKHQRLCGDGGGALDQLGAAHDAGHLAVEPGERL